MDKNLKHCYQGASYLVNCHLATFVRYKKSQNRWSGFWENMVVMYYIWQISLKQIGQTDVPVPVFSSLKQAQVFNAGLGVQKNTGPSFYSSIIEVLVYNCIRAIIARLIYENQHLLLLSASLVLQPALALTATIICHCRYYGTASSSSGVSCYINTVNRLLRCQWASSFNRTLLAGNPNCLWFSCACYKITGHPTLTCQRVINTKRR